MRGFSSGQPWPIRVGDWGWVTVHKKCPYFLCYGANRNILIDELFLVLGCSHYSIQGRMILVWYGRDTITPCKQSRFPTAGLSMLNHVDLTASQAEGFLRGTAMYTSISSRKGAFVAALAAAALAAMLGIKPASATTTVTNLVANGDFSANAASFTTFPGTVGGGNPATITDWASVNGTAGAPTNATGVNFAAGSGSGAPFGPQSGFAFAFLQGAGTSISQAVSGLTVGQAYSVSYLAASRYDPNTVTPITQADLDAQALTATITNGSQTDGSLMSTDSNTAAGTVMTPNFFQLQLFGFTASAGTETLTFTNSSPSTYDTTVDVSGVVIDPINSAVPEPATLGLLALGGLGLLLLKRRNAV